MPEPGCRRGRRGTSRGSNGWPTTSTRKTGLHVEKLDGTRSRKSLVAPWPASTTGSEQDVAPRPRRRRAPSARRAPPRTSRAAGAREAQRRPRRARRRARTTVPRRRRAARASGSTSAQPSAGAEQVGAVEPTRAAPGARSGSSTRRCRPRGTERQSSARHELRELPRLDAIDVARSVQLDRRDHEVAGEHARRRPRSWRTGAARRASRRAGAARRRRRRRPRRCPSSAMPIIRYVK